ncbi:MAG: hypothetical protein K2X48_00410 [Chitinophagaceae bacterium]|nr:hypothetical protein [Chitinophagaceae bacterium]
MQDLLLKQLQYECDTWKRLLAFLMDENVHLKNRLSEIVKNRDGTTSLNEIERFQTDFLKGDELIKVLRDDISEVDKLLQKEVFEDGALEKKIQTKFSKIRVNIPLAERQLGQLKKDFNNYLLANA